MELADKLKAAENKSTAAFHMVMARRHPHAREAMTMAEAIGLPRMWRNPLHLSQDVVDENLLEMFTDSAIVMLYLRVLDSMCASYRRQLKDPMCENIEREKRKILRENENIIKGKLVIHQMFGQGDFFSSGPNTLSDI